MANVSDFEGFPLPVTFYSFCRFTFVLNFNIDIIPNKIKKIGIFRYSHKFLYISNIQTGTPLV